MRAAVPALITLAIAACDAPVGADPCNDDDDCDGAVCLGGVCVESEGEGDGAGEGEGEGDAAGGEGEGEAAGEGEGEAAGEGEGDGEGEGEGEGAGEGEGEAPPTLVVPAAALGRVGEDIVVEFGFAGGDSGDLVVVADLDVPGSVVVDGSVAVVVVEGAGPATLRLQAARGFQVVDSATVALTVRPADWDVLAADRRTVVQIVDDASPVTGGGTAPVRVDVGDDRPRVWFGPAPLAATRGGPGQWWVRPASMTVDTVFVGYVVDDEDAAGPVADPFADYDAHFHFEDDLASRGVTFVGASVGDAVFEDGALGRQLRLRDSPVVLGAPADLIAGDKLTVTVHAVVTTLPDPGAIGALFGCSLAGAGPDALLSRFEIGIKDTGDMILTVRGNDISGDGRQVTLATGYDAGATIDVGVLINAPNATLISNGTNASTTAVGLPFDAGASARCVIGSDEDLATKYFDGVVDELRVSRLARTNVTREVRAMSTAFTTLTNEVAP